MIANIKYYVVSIVAIFLALAIGIYIGFMFDAQEILLSQKEDIVAQLEERFDYLEEENKQVKEEIDKITKENSIIKEFNRLIYKEVIKEKLTGLNIAIIETSGDYIYKELEETLELAGANVTSMTAINKNFETNLEQLRNIYEDTYTLIESNEDIIELIIVSITKEIILGEGDNIINKLNINGIIDAIGEYTTPINYIILAGGSREKDDRFNTIDIEIIKVCREMNIPIIGVERENVVYSYVENYIDNRISSVDNVDTIMGKVALVLAIDGRPGNYGVKPTAEKLIPNIEL